MQRRGVSELTSFVFFVAIGVTAIGIALNVGLPQIALMEETSSVQNSVTFLTELDAVIRDVAAGGTYSSRTIGLRFQDGQYRFDPDQEQFYYEIETETDMISTHARQQMGPVTVSANTDVIVEDTTVNGVECHIMENEHLEACIRHVPEEFDPDTHPGLVGYWRMDGDGDWANDSSRYGRDGMLENGPTRTGGVHNDALDFDGADDTVNVTDSADMDLVNFTLTAWVNMDTFDTAVYPVIVSKGTSGSETPGENINYLLGVNRTGYGLVAFEERDGTDHGVTTDAPLPTDRWLHLAGQYNNATGKFTLFVDGRENATITAPGKPEINDQQVGIGSGFRNGVADDHINATLDEVRIYNRSLTPEEIRWQYLQRGDLHYVNTSEMLVHMRNKNEDETLNGSLYTQINGDAETRAGRGHTIVDEHGQVGRGMVTVNVSTDTEGQYDTEYQLLSGADFLTVRAAADTVTTGLDFVVDDRDSDIVYIGGSQRDAGVYTDDDIDFGYGVGEGNSLMAGVVAGTGFSRVGYDDATAGSRYALNVTAADSGTFLVPFSTGTHNDVQDRKDLIRGGVYGSNRFFGYPTPSFGHALTEEKTVRTALSYDTIHLSGQGYTISPGSHQLLVENHGAADGQANVSVTIK